MNFTHSAQSFDVALTVPLRELLERYLAKNPPGNASDRNNILKAFQLLLELFPEADTASFKAEHLLVYRNNLVKQVSERTGKTYAIDYCNKLVNFVRSVFNWGMNPNLKAVALADIIDPLVSEITCFSLSKVPLLQPGEGRKNPERIDVPLEDVDPVLALLPEHIADMLRLQLLTSLRPGEVCKMRVGDIRKKKGSSASTTGFTSRASGFTFNRNTKPQDLSATKWSRSASKPRKSWKNTSETSQARRMYSRKSPNAVSESRLLQRNVAVTSSGGSTDTNFRNSLRTNFGTLAFRRLRINMAATRPGRSPGIPPRP